ncbi:MULTISPECIES: hypothetical protein [Aminobacterium]|jgi:CheY-like chemotaxis protein|uniref:hypothetical protein n=1 Tax=Aminobacterium TaxID=81466 RepID=UPI00257967BE|nr:hypothetical protein [Aminobacterium sp. UBA4987]
MLEEKNIRLVKILLVERKEKVEQDIFQSLRELKIFNTIHVVGSRYEALEYLRQVGKYWDRPKPDIVMADCDLPGNCCEGLLFEMRNDPALCYIPILFITSQDESVPFETSDYMARFVEKPFSGSNILEALMSFDRFGMAVVKAE